MTELINRDGSVLVWGALGFLGQHMVARLLRHGATVSVLCRPRHLYPIPPWGSRVQWFEQQKGGDDQATLMSAVSSASLIYNFAGSSGAVASNQKPLESLEANCRTQLAFLEACERAGHRPHVVFASSWLVYGVTGGAPVSETHPVAPRSMYAAHKLCIEHYLQIFEQRNKITYTICRISNPYGFDPSGVGNTYKVLNSFIQQALAGAPICLFGDGRQLRDFIQISDLADALIRCGYSPQARNELFNVSSGKSYTLLEAAETIGELAGAPKVLFKPWPEEYRAVESGDYVADISKARTKLGLMPAYELRAGLEETIRQYRQHKATQGGRGTADVAVSCPGAGSGTT